MSTDARPEPSRIRFRFTKAAGVWLAIAVILGVVGWYKSINLLLLLGYMMGALLGINAYSAWRAATRISATRRPSRNVFPGESVEVATEVSNTSTRSVTARITDESAGNRAAWMLTPLLPGAVQTLTVLWTYTSRGRHPVGPLVVDSSYPFGVLHAFRDIAAPGEVVVLPEVGRVDREMFRRWLVRGGSSDGHARRPARRPAAGSGDVRGLRPYRPGDSPRDVHWRTSARRGQLLVREYDHSEPLALVIVVDPYRPSYSEDATWRLEWALSLATTLGVAWAEAEDGTDLTLIVPGESPFVRTGRGTPGFIRNTFAILAGIRGESHVLQLPADCARIGSRRAARVIVSSRALSPLGDGFRKVGLPYATVDPLLKPVWFTPPKPLAR